MKQMNMLDFIKNNITILDYIPFGKENAIRRSTLSDLTKISDRTTRKILKHLIADYGVIANYETGGYYRTTDITEINAAIMIAFVRMSSIQHTVEQLEEYKKKIDDAKALLFFFKIVSDIILH